MNALKSAANAFFFVTVPVWWPCMLTVEVAQILLFRTPPTKLLGPAIYDWLQRGKMQHA